MGDEDDEGEDGATDDEDASDPTAATGLSIRQYCLKTVSGAPVHQPPPLHGTWHHRCNNVDHHNEDHNNTETLSAIHS